MYSGRSRSMWPVNITSLLQIWSGRSDHQPGPKWCGSRRGGADQEGPLAGFIGIDVGLPRTSMARKGSGGSGAALAANKGDEAVYGNVYGAS